MFPRSMLAAVTAALLITVSPVSAHASNPHEKIGDDLAADLSEQLSQVSQSYAYSNIGITRWVLAETLEFPQPGDSLYKLSHQLSESIYAHLKEYNLNVVEFRAQDYITLTKDGATAMAREVDELETHPKLDWVLVGTLSRKDAGTMVNLRIIDRRNQEVLAAANRYVPKHLYWPNKQTELVNGRLQRH
ncbi:FlgO family outer membrane protein [Idiomarina aminovorans]|uniref:FlgO family outer membrane protein n=1 Tax=Idiomarina aminovorans TaxID=2914829 RepID=UPI002003F800|nr:FlgO family outer membrane protein [Idiomarina sp. ATCH4]MCK7458010.1 FlgO family outer membrane protein [Idiomarina sp. ATCH4]